MKHLLFAFGLVALCFPASSTAAGPMDGRFQLIQLSQMRRDQFLLDTHTGKIWRSACLVSDPNESADCRYQAWVSEDVEGISATPDAIDRVVTRIKKKYQQPVQADPQPESPKRSFDSISQ